MNIQDIRQQYPQYDAMTDDELARRLYDAEYSSVMSYEDFAGRIGLDPGQQAPIPGQARPNRTLKERIGRPIALTGRYLAEGLSETADIFTNPIRAGLRQVPIFEDSFSESTSQGVKRLMDKYGVAAPETPAEQVVGTASKLVAGVGPFVKGGQVISQATTPIVRNTGTAAAQIMPTSGTREAGRILSTGPGMQAATAAAAGAGGEYEKQQGGSVGEQLVASMIAGLSPAGAKAVADRAAKTFTPMAGRVDRILAQYDMQGVPLGVVQNLRERVQKALQVGNVDEARLARMVAYAKTGATPTRGKISRDPIEFGTEENLSRIGAQSTDENIQTLARLKGENLQKLIDGLDDIAEGTGLDLFRAGEATIGDISRRNNQLLAIRQGLYAKARDSAGRALPLRRDEFIRRADLLLRQQNKNQFLPAEIRGMLNDIAYGIKTSKGETIEVPFNVDVIDQLETTLATAQRGTKDGNVKAAIGAVKQALMETDVEAPQGAQVAAESLKAFRRARRFAKKLFDWQKKTPAIKAIVDGDATPDQFVKEFVIGQTRKASVENLSKTMKQVTDPEVKAVLRNQVAAWIRNQATNNQPVDMATFSQARLRSALDKIGDRKLDILFGAADRKQLRAIAEVGALEQVPPAGASINYSASGTTLIANFANWLERKTSMLPGADLFIRQPMRAAADLAEGRGILEPVVGVAREKAKAPIAIPLAIGGGESVRNAFEDDGRGN